MAALGRTNNIDFYVPAAGLSSRALRDLEALHATLREPGAPLTDAELAIQLARREAESLETLNRDRELAFQLEAEDLEVPGDAIARARPRQTNAGVLQRPPDAANRRQAATQASR